MYPRRRWVGRTILVILFFLLLSHVASIAIRGFSKDSAGYKILSPLADPISASKEILGAQTNSSLAEVVSSAMEGTQGEYAIVIKNFKTKETYLQNEHKTFDSASLYKLWVMAEVFSQMSQGKFSTDDEIKEDIADLNKRFDIATEAAEFTEGRIETTVGQALTQMIMISHNYSAISLTKKVGVSKVAAFLKQYGFSQSNVGQPPHTSASDIARYFELLYKRELVDEKSSEEMLSLLKKQQLNDRIPKYLPEDIEVAHKTGELDYQKHDAGIIFSEKGDYIIVVLSKSTSPQGAAERIARLSRRVFDYFQR